MNSNALSQLRKRVTTAGLVTVESCGVFGITLKYVILSLMNGYGRQQITALCCYREYLEGPKVFKSKCLVFAQFCSKFNNSTSGWSATVKIFMEKYFCHIFVKNVSPVAKKPDGGVRPT